MIKYISPRIVHESEDAIKRGMGFLYMDWTCPACGKEMSFAYYKSESCCPKCGRSHKEEEKD